MPQLKLPLRFLTGTANHEVIMNEERFHSFPQTHHSTCAQAVYEQCVWDEEHVLSIYPILSGILQADGEWHDVPSHSERIGRYRVFREQYFQAVFAASSNPVYEVLCAMDPVASQDDAEWAIWQIDGENAFALSSTFAITPGPFQHQKQVDEWLWRHALGLVPFEFHVEGVAYFAEIEPGCLLDAMDRLVWLEQALADLNERFEGVGDGFWRELQAESSIVLQDLAGSLRSNEIAPLPARYRREGWKQREAV